MQISSGQKKLLSWFHKNKRPLPWRQSKDPYKIWISETMLQQTTTTAVVPFFHRFIAKFPTLKTLAQAEDEDVYEIWAGLGYYSRARNLLKAAKILNQSLAFPTSYKELITLPGFGPYTARAVSSIAFQEPVGVIDGNVIRVISRLYSTKFQWWRSAERKELQTIADQWVEQQKSSEVNQALMELGATICLPKNPKCMLCPLTKNCVGQKQQTIEQLPMKKPKKQKQIWLWQAEVHLHKGYIGLVKNDYAPFLKKQLFLPGTSKLTSTPPNDYVFKHMITHHEIYVQTKVVTCKNKTRDFNWVPIKDLTRHAPASLIHKAVHTIS